jgi:hypothetical protein
MKVFAGILPNLYSVKRLNFMGFNSFSQNLIVCRSKFPVSSLIFEAFKLLRSFIDSIPSKYLDLSSNKL